DRSQRFPDRGPKERLAELERRSQLGGGVAAGGGAGDGPTSQLCGLVLVMVHPERRRAPQLHVELDGRIPHRLREGRQLGESIEPLVRLAQGSERVVASRKQDPSV